MIAVDTNILIYAHREASPFHQAASDALTSLCEGPLAWALPWPCIHEFMAVVTSARHFESPSTPEEAVEQAEVWLESPSVVLLAESGQHWPELRTLVLKGRVAGTLIHEARIAALCLQHGVRELWSADRDFSRFPDLQVVNPLLR